MLKVDLVGFMMISSPLRDLRAGLGIEFEEGFHQDVIFFGNGYPAGNS
jgi:hypothetical protein